MLTLADRSPCFSNFQHKLTFNRTLSNYHYHDSSKKPSPSFSSNNCDQCPCSRLSSPLARAFVSPSRISNDGRRNQLPGANGSDACLADDERQHHRYISHGDALECTTQLTCTVNNNDGSRRRKSASLNSPASIGNIASFIDHVSFLILSFSFQKIDRPLKTLKN